jgi:hypothetical protein
MRTRTPRAFSAAASPGKNESSFGEIHFPRQGLHLLGTQAASVKKNRQRVAGEGAIGKNTST